MENRVTFEAAGAAAEWWAGKVAAPKFDNLGPTRGVNTVASMLAGMTAAANEPSAEQLASFKRTLQNLVFAAQPTGLHVDYHPDDLLSRAAEEAGISASRFPWKSHTWFTPDGKVEAAYGYGAPVEPVFPVEAAEKAVEG